jgi:UDP:flavonoid glycosyltransferase YjiC (YdhE family)
MRLVRSRWPYGEFTTWVQPESPLTPEALRQAVADVLTQPGYRVAARALSEEASRYGGAEAASDLIEKLT